MTPQLGPWRAERVLGRGGMGVVYEAVHAETGERAAVKTVTEASARVVAALRREAEVLARLSHPQIVRFIAFGLHDGLPWQATELVRGPDLRATFHTGVAGSSATLWTPTLDGSPDETSSPEEQPGVDSRMEVAGGRLPQVLAVVRALCDPLAYLHGQGLVHRDLKPENVLLRDGVPVLLDFGLLARSTARSRREQLQEVGGIAGTASTIAPEQVRGELVDARADLYALGCVLYELLTGRPPFTGPLEAVLERHLWWVPVAPSNLVQGIPPGLDDLVLALLAKDPRERPGHATDVGRTLEGLGAPPSPLDTPPARPYLYRPAFSGRSDDLEALADLIRAPAAAQAWIGGPSGAGKTRLAVEVARVMRRAGTRVVFVQATADASSGSGAGGTLRTLLQRLRDIARDEEPDLFGSSGRVLAAVEPTLLHLEAVAASPPVEELPPARARRRLVDAVDSALHALGDARSTTLLVDDLQWADPILLDVLQRRPGVFVLGTYRSEEVRDPLARLLAQSCHRHVRLGPLGIRAVTAMVSDMLAADPAPSDLVANVAAHAEGNPFFVAEYVQAGLDAGLLARRADGVWHTHDPAAIGALPLPNTLRELARRRLDAVPPSARAALALAAVIGREVDPDLLERAAGSPIGLALQDLIAAHVLEATDDGFRFAHDKLREAAYEVISSPEPLHRVVAETLAEAGASGPQLASHWEAAGERSLARRAWFETGHSRLVVPEVAIAAFERALALIDEPTAQTARERLYLAETLLSDAGAVDAAFAQLEAARRTATTLDDALLETDCLRVETLLRSHHGHQGGAVDVGRRLLEAAAAAGDPERLAAAHQTMGGVHLRLRQYPKARDQYGAGLAVVSTLAAPAPVLEARLRGGRGIALVELKQFAPAERDVRRALELLEAHGSQAQIGSALHNLAEILSGQGKYDEATTLYERAIAAAKACGSSRREAIAQANLGQVRFVLGHLERAYRAYSRCLELYVDLGDPLYHGYAHYYLARYHRFADRDLDAAERHAERARELCHEARSPYDVAECIAELGITALARGRPAQPYLSEARRTLDSSGLGHLYDPCPVIQRLRRAQALAAAGEPLVGGEPPEDAPPWATR